MIGTFQNVIIDGVEGSEVHRIELSFRQAQESAFHLIGSRPGKSDDQNGIGLYPALLNQTADALRDGIRLSGAGTGKNEHRSVPVGNGFRLAGIGAGCRHRFLRRHGLLLPFQEIIHSGCPAASGFRYGCGRGTLPFQEFP